MTNVGGDDVVLSDHTSEENMTAYDRLPASIRSFVSGMSIGWAPADILDVYEKHGEVVTLGALRKTERDMQTAYYGRIGLAA